MQTLLCNFNKICIFLNHDLYNSQKSIIFAPDFKNGYKISKNF